MPAYKYIFKIAASTKKNIIDAHPIYNSIKIKKTRSDKAMYFRTTVSGEVKFKGRDYDYVVNSDTHTKFTLLVLDNALNNVAALTFMYTDMKINASKKTVTVEPTISDGLDKILNNLSTEYDLAKLDARPSLVKYKVSEAVQIASAYNSKVTNCYRNNIAEYDVAERSYDELSSMGFSKGLTIFKAKLTLTDPAFFSSFVGTACIPFRYPSVNSYDTHMHLQVSDPSQIGGDDYWAYVRRVPTDYQYMGGVKTRVELWVSWLSKYSMYVYSIILAREINGVWDYKSLGGDPLTAALYDHSQYSASRLYAGLVTYRTYSRFSASDVYFTVARCRRITNAPGEQFTQDDDMAQSYIHRYYKSMDLDGGLYLSTETSQEKTKYGVSHQANVGSLLHPEFEPRYYTCPWPGCKPIMVDKWAEQFSIWVDPSFFVLDEFDASCNNFYEVGEMIRSMLAKIDDTIRFMPEQQYSEFLYGASAFSLHEHMNTSKKMMIMLTQRSNANKPNANYFAQKMPITLGAVLDMLRIAFNIYWFVENNEFHLEHYSWFANGRDYERNGFSSIKLNDYVDKFNKLPLSFATGEYTYDVDAEYSTNKLAWHEECSDSFSDDASEMEGSYDVDNTANEESISRIIADIEYCAIMGKALSQDGNVVVTTTRVQNSNDGSRDVILYNNIVNGEMSTDALYDLYKPYNMPGTSISRSTGNITIISPAKAKRGSARINMPNLVKDVYSSITNEAGTGYVISLMTDLDTGIQDVELEFDRDAN